MSRRLERLSNTLKREIAFIIQKYVADPRIGAVSITAVTLSADVKIAKVYIVSLAGKGDKKKVVQGLQSASTFIQSHLAKRIHTKTIPQLCFYYDDRLEKGTELIYKMQKCVTNGTS